MDVWLERLFQYTGDDCREAGGMPVKAEDAAKRLEPQRVGEPAQEFRLPVLVDYYL